MKNEEVKSVASLNCRENCCQLRCKFEQNYLVITENDRSLNIDRKLREISALYKIKTKARKSNIFFNSEKLQYSWSTHQFCLSPLGMQMVSRNFIFREFLIKQLNYD